MDEETCGQLEQDTNDDTGEKSNRGLEGREMLNILKADNSERALHASLGLEDIQQAYK